MTAIVCTAVEPVGIVKSAAAQPQDVRKSFEVEIERCPAPATEVQRYALVARSERCSYVFAAVPSKTTSALRKIGSTR